MMIEQDMEDVQLDLFGRPLKFTPTWPPKAVEKPMPKATPTFSLAFRKSGWPPKTGDDSDQDQGSNSTANGVANGTSNGQQEATSNGPVSEPVKPQKAVKDYSAFFAKNAAPPTRRVYVLQPGQVALPEAFTKDPDAEEEVQQQMPDF